MQTKNLIQASANVIKITNLKIGDVFKQIEESSYSDNEIYYGVVTDLMSTGEKAFISVLRYKKSYNSVEGQFKTFSGDKDINMFPCEIDEVRDYLKDALESQSESIKKTKKELQEKIEAYEKASQFVSGEMSKSLSCMSFEEITQNQYNQIKIEKKKKLEALESDETF